MKIRTTIAACLLLNSSAFALDEGTRQIILKDNAGEEFAIGTLNLVRDGEQFSYQLEIDHSDFADYFLSMKEMKCLEGPELWCHLQYPYEHASTLSENDFSWLSHDLLFMYKKPEEFGANFWNGIYYEITYADGRLMGEARAVDLNMLASPPDDLTVPPFGEYDRYELEKAARWLPEIEFR